MVEDAAEIAIIAKARQKNVADPRRSREPFFRIFGDFFENVELQDQHVVDLGPGQHDFGELARSRGGTVVGFDNDPAVLELGRHKGFAVRDVRFQELGSIAGGPRFDGLFCKFSLNAFWFTDLERLHSHLAGVLGMLRPGAWGWVAPWNGVPRGRALSEQRISEVLSAQASAFASEGFEGFDLTHDLTVRYGVHGAVANNALFVRGLSAPPALSGCRKL